MHDLQNVLPCPSCGTNLEGHMTKHPIESHLKSRDSMVTWMVDIHNMVNAKNGKKELSLDEVMHQFNEAYSKGNSQKYLEVIGRSFSAPTAQLSAIAGAVSAIVMVLCMGFL